MFVWLTFLTPFCIILLHNKTTETDKLYTLQATVRVFLSSEQSGIKLGYYFKFIFHPVNSKIYDLIFQIQHLNQFFILVSLVM